MISIIIPTYNERENIELLIGKIKDQSNKINEELEIIIVDDNSPDGTWKMVQEMGTKDKRIRLVKRAGKLGLATAVLDGVKKASGDKIIVMDADLSHPAEKLPEFAEWLREVDLVIGSRNIRGGGSDDWPIYRKIVSMGATFLANIVLGVWESDPMSGFFGVKKKIIENTKFKAKGYKILLNILAYNKGIKIKEIPYMFKDRYAGETKLGSGEIVTYLKDLYSLRKQE